MTDNYLIYKVPDFIRKNEAGEINYEKSLIKIKELMDASTRNESCNIVIDLRDTETKLNFVDSLMLALEFAEYREVFKNKIAFIIPDDKERIARAEYVKNSLVQLKDIQMDYFTEYEKAIDWLSFIEIH